jgi:hypothetical protein
MTDRMATPKPKGISRASKPRKSATRSKAPAKAGATAKTGAGAERAPGQPASRLIDERIRSLGDWRANTLAEVRRLIHEADPEIVEECKWIKPSNPLGVPVWSHAGIVCTGEAYKQVVKLTFGRGASLADPRGLFNSSLEGNSRRAIDIREGEVLDAEAFKALIRAAVAENLRSRAPKSKSPTKSGAKTKPVKVKKGDKLVLLSGGNPQIAKADGDAPVQAFIAAMPGWKRDVGRRLDALIVRSVPNVRKAVKWNSPLYGIEGQGWFLGIHCFTKYVKVAFFRGKSLRPVPPGESKQKEVRYLDIYEDDPLDEAQFAAWLKQASQLPGERM